MARIFVSNSDLPTQRHSSHTPIKCYLFNSCLRFLHKRYKHFLHKNSRSVIYRVPVQRDRSQDGDFQITR